MAETTKIELRVVPYVDAIDIADQNGDLVCHMADRELHLQGMPPELARRIVTCWNSHDELVAACELVMRWDGENVYDGTTSWLDVFKAVSAALAKAKA